MSTDAYSTLFNQQLSDLNNPNIIELTKKGPETIRLVATQLEDQYWTPALTTWAKCVTGFAISSDKALLNTPILGNPIFGKPWYKNLKQPKTLVFGVTKSAITQADFRTDLRHVQFKHVISNDYYVDRPALTDILGQNIDALEYNKLLPILKTGHQLLQTVHKTNHETDIINWTFRKKGTKHLKSLMNYEKLTIDQLTSTKYWRKIPEIASVCQDLFKNSFNNINIIPISSKDKSDLLKIRHNIVGTPHIRAKYADTMDDCAFCAIDKRDPHSSCTKSALPEMLYTCKTTKFFTQNIASLPSLSTINLKTDPISRLIYQKDPKNAGDLNFTHAMLNLYLRKTAYFKKIPNLTDFHNFLLPRITLALRRQSLQIHDSFLTELLLDTKPINPSSQTSSP